MRFWQIILVLVLFGCSEDDASNAPIQVHNVESADTLEAMPLVESVSLMDSTVVFKYQTMGLSEVTDPRIIVDLRYATNNNFMQTILYDTLDKMYLQLEVVERISRCQDLLDSLKPGMHLKLFDGVRPLLVQKEMWDALDTVPAGMRGKFVSNPKYGSVHNYGTAVDITICDSTGKELDMGAGYDDFRPIAFPSKEAYFLEKGELTKIQYEKRKLLRRIMRSQQFYNIPSEWWHFNAFSRKTAEAKFDILLDESGHHQKWVSPPIYRDALSDTTNHIH